jgi:hypothetical protein
MSPPVLIASAVALSVDSVMGIGQNRPLAIFMPSQTPCQSVWVMKPSSGVKPPMPSMMMSPFSRELTLIFGSVWARASSACCACALQQQGSQCAPAVRIDQCHDRVRV